VRYIINVIILKYTKFEKPLSSLNLKMISRFVILNTILPLLPNIGHECTARLTQKYIVLFIIRSMYTVTYVTTVK